jgi:hypothetical protein
MVQLKHLNKVRTVALSEGEYRCVTVVALHRAINTYYLFCIHLCVLANHPYSLTRRHDEGGVRDAFGVARGMNDCDIMKRWRREESNYSSEEDVELAILRSPF